MNGRLLVRKCAPYPRILLANSFPILKLNQRHSHIFFWQVFLDFLRVLVVFGEVGVLKICSIGVATPFPYPRNIVLVFVRFSPVRTTLSQAVYEMPIMFVGFESLAKKADASELAVAVPLPFLLLSRKRFDDLFAIAAAPYLFIYYTIPKGIRIIKKMLAVAYLHAAKIMK